MFFRRPTQVALDASLFLALEPEGSSRPVREIADALGVPATYLAKVLQSLTRTHLLRSVRGPGGGVQLARPAREIRLWDILSAIDTLDGFECCMLGLRHCNDLHPCPLHTVWAPTRDRILHMLKTKNLREFATDAQRSGRLYEDPARTKKTGSASPRVGDKVRREKNHF